MEQISMKFESKYSLVHEICRLQNDDHFVSASQSMCYNWTHLNLRMSCIELFGNTRLACLCVNESKTKISHYEDDAAIMALRAYFPHGITLFFNQESLLQNLQIVILLNLLSYSLDDYHTRTWFWSN